MGMARLQRQLRRKLQIRVDRHCLHRSTDTQSGGGGRPAVRPKQCEGVCVQTFFALFWPPHSKGGSFLSRCESSVQIIHVTCLFNQVGGRTHEHTFARTHPKSVSLFYFCVRSTWGWKEQKASVMEGCVRSLFSLSNAPTIWPHLLIVHLQEGRQP